MDLSDPKLIRDLVVGMITLILSIAVHEFGHAIVADKLGDRLPRYQGRVTLNPLVHADPIGTYALPIIGYVLTAASGSGARIGFGWGKPVQVNPYALRPGRVGMAYVAAAGPLANLVAASVVAVLFRGLVLAGVITGPDDFAWVLLITVVQFNIILGLFNLLPIPPLDGYNLVLPFLPADVAMTIQRYAPYGIMVLLLLVLLPQITGGVSPLGWLADAANTITAVLTGI